MSSVSSSPCEIGEQAAAYAKRRRSGMTLVEVLVATFVLFIIAAGILDVLMSAYKLTLVTRHSDNARAVLVSMADQFSRLNATEANSTTTLLADSMWQPTGTTTNVYGTGVGLSWDGVAGTTDGLKVTLGDAASSAIPAVVYRKVNYVQNTYPYSSGNGIKSTDQTDMLSATFTIVFTVSGQEKTESLTVSRLWRNANLPTS